MRPRAAPVFRLLRLVLALVMIGGILFVWIAEYSSHRTWERGLPRSEREPLSKLTVPRYGLNTALLGSPSELSAADMLDTTVTLGVRVIRQRIAWDVIEPNPGTYDWSVYDSVLAECAAHDLQLIAVLDTSPAWARPGTNPAKRYAPPDDAADYARFAGLVAERYGRQIIAYQIWDQPNINDHWHGEINPQRYVELLRQASAVLHAADPDALIIGGNMAPTTERSGLNLSDVQYLREINRRGAGAYYDVLGIRVLGFWSAPEDRRVSEEVLNFSRAILLREEMLARGLGSKDIWALESGWCALPPGWQGQPSPSGSDDELLQAERLWRAMLRAEREWPWLGLVCLPALQPEAALDDPAWGYALLSPLGEGRHALAVAARLLQRPRLLFPGVTRALDEAIMQPDANTQMISFYGSDVWVELAGLKPGMEISLAIDDDPPQDISWPQGAETLRVHAGEHLARHAHRLAISSRGGNPTISAVQVLNLARPGMLHWQSLAAILALAYLFYAVYRNLRALKPGVLWRQLRARIQLPAWVLLAAMLVLLGVALVRPGMLPLAALALYGLFALFNPRSALWAAMLTVPFAPLQLRPLSLTFSVAEVTLLAAVAAQVWNWLLGMGAPRPRLRLSWLDAGVILLLAAMLTSTILAEYQRVAWREFRVVILGSFLWYGLIRLQSWEPHELVHMQRVLVISGVCVALVALVWYLFPSGVVAAEGVRRARAFYGSPNNLALYLERVLPMAVGLATLVRERKRGMWLAGAGLILMAIILSFSRGALLLGLPAAALVLLFMLRGSQRWLVAGLGVSLLVAVVAMLGSERLAQLFDPARGTTLIRVGLWQASWRLALDHPLWGVGPDNFIAYYRDYIAANALVEPNLSHPHNIALDFWLRGGAAGLAALGVITAGIVGALRRILRGARGTALGHLALACLAGLAAMPAHGLIDSSFFVTELAYWAAIVLAWLATAQQLTLETAS
ncbi:MAG: hypothetical protein GXY52_10175 [Chloroflexi bacterium]|nr:hypothetical protein [Chloroflexota bacterium]